MWHKNKYHKFIQTHKFGTELHTNMVFKCVTDTQLLW